MTFLYDCLFIHTDAKRRLGETCYGKKVKLKASSRFKKKYLSFFMTDDFLLLLFASFQWQVFEDEDQPVVRLQAGDNSEINQDLGPAGLSEFSRVPNFIYCRSEIKENMFMFGFLQEAVRLHNILSSRYVGLKALIIPSWYNY